MVTEREDFDQENDMYLPDHPGWVMCGRGYIEFRGYWQSTPHTHYPPRGMPKIGLEVAAAMLSHPNHSTHTHTI